MGVNASEMSELMNLAFRKGVKGVDLGELVHEAKSAEASGINNDGMYSQLAYLVESYGLKGTRVIVDNLK